MAETDSMVAGPELDAKVAEEVMGYTEISLSKQRPPFNWPNLGRPPGGDSKVALPGFSTDWSAAGEVLEKLRQDGYWVDLADCRIGWNMQVGKHDKGGRVWERQVFGPYISEVAATGPLAICLAALATARKNKR